MPSTNKTPNIELNAFIVSDSPKMADFNSDNTKTDTAIGAVQTEIKNHKSDKNNPHALSKAQVGLGNVDNIKQAAKAEFDGHVGNVDIHTSAAEKARLEQELGGKAPISSPNFTGTAKVNGKIIATTEITSIPVTPLNGFHTVPGYNSHIIKNDGVRILNASIINSAPIDVQTVIYTLEPFHYVGIVIAYTNDMPFVCWAYADGSIRSMGELPANKDIHFCFAFN